MVHTIYIVAKLAMITMAAVPKNFAPAAAGAIADADAA